MPDLDRVIINRLYDEATIFSSEQGVEEGEFDVYLANLPDSWDGTLGGEPLPALKLMYPPPSVNSLPIDTVVEKGTEGRLISNRGVEIVRLQRYVVTRISRLQFSDEDLRPDYWLVVLRGTAVTPELARDRVIPRYRLIGSPILFDEAWKVTLVDER